jgi:hypothetical protein
MTGLLLRLYPRAWRDRYGAELEELIRASSGGRLSRRVWLDVVAGAVREHLRTAGLAGDSPPASRARSGALVVLCAWAVFVVGGAAVQKFSEHWQDDTPVGARGVPSAAYDVLVAAAVVGSVLVVAGIVLALPALLRFLREGGWPLVRDQVAAAAVLTILAAGSLAGLAAWAHTLTAPQRNGSDPAYSGLGAATLLLLLGSLALWTAAAVACVRRLHLSHRLLGVEGLLAAGVAASMATMTVATAVWWGALARTAQPGFFGPAAPVAPELLVATALMLVATASGAFGAHRALHGARLG